MSRVNKVSINNVQKVNTNKKIDNKSEIQKSFKSKLDDIGQEKIREDLNILYDKIQGQSGKLKDKLFIDDLIKYKTLVKEFLNITVNNSHVFYKENSLDRRGRHRIYALVKRVDAELEELTDDFTNVEASRLRILKRLDNINGLLLDTLA